MNAPIVALIQEQTGLPPVHQMTSEERRAFVQRLRALRTSPQTLTAQLNAESEELEAVEMDKPLRRRSKKSSVEKAQDISSRYDNV